jgi:Tetratricopeptide repeat
MAVLRDTGDGDAFTRWAEAIAHNALAIVHLQTGNPKAAITEHQQALQAVRDGGNPFPEAETLLGLAAANLALKRPDPAAKSGASAEARHEAGVAHMDATAPDRAASAYASQALTIARDRGYRMLEERAAAMLARSPSPTA